MKLIKFTFEYYFRKFSSYMVIVSNNSSFIAKGIFWGIYDVKEAITIFASVVNILHHFVEVKHFGLFPVADEQVERFGLFKWETLPYNLLELVCWKVVWNQKPRIITKFLDEKALRTLFYPCLWAGLFRAFRIWLGFCLDIALESFLIGPFCPLMLNQVIQIKV